MKSVRILAAALLWLLASQSAFAAKVHIAEFNRLPDAADNTRPPIAPMPALAKQLVDFSGGVTSSSAFGTTTRYIRVNCDTRCAIEIGAGPQTATTSSMPLGPDAPEYFGVSPGHILSVIAAP